MEENYCTKTIHHTQKNNKQKGCTIQRGKFYYINTIDND